MDTFFSLNFPFVIIFAIILNVNLLMIFNVSKVSSTTHQLISITKITTQSPTTTLTTTPTQTSTLPSKLPLNSPCTNSSVCGQNTFCHQTGSTLHPDGHCRCLLGYLPSPANHIDCNPFNCTFSDLQCHNTFTNFTRCSLTPPNICICDTSFKLNSSNQKCIPEQTPLSSKCNWDKDCGSNTVCNGDSKCSCRLGTLPVPWNDLNCDYFHCTEDTDCRIFSPNTLCVAGACYCNQQNSTLDHDTQKCIFSGQKIGGKCTMDRECGTNANCVESFCRCQFGYVPSLNMRDCGVFHCNSTIQCTSLVDDHSRCQGKLCECMGGYEVNPALQSCVPNSVNFNCFSKKFILICLFLSLLNFIFIY